jgi:hypothetical protein
MDASGRLKRNRARTITLRQGKSASIHYALKRVLMGIREARRIIRSLRHQQREPGALESMERVQYEQDAFVRRED